MLRRQGGAGLDLDLPGPSSWLAATFFILGIGNANGRATVVKIGGWVGIATAAAAWYASFASVTNSTFGRTVLPVGPLHD